VAAFPAEHDSVCSTATDETDRSILQAAPGQEPEERNRMKKLLIIDDDVNLTKIYTRIGAQAGFEVQVTNDPLLATETFLAFKPEVVMLDMIMPEKDGIDVLNEILLSGEPTRIIVSSGYGNAMLRLAKDVGEFHGCDRVFVLKKPFRNTDLRQLLMEVPAE
jgi:DNA-binding NtrC family response regulator